MKDSDFVNSSSWPKLTEWCSSCTRTRLVKLVLPREEKVFKEEIIKEEIFKEVASEGIKKEVIVKEESSYASTQTPPQKGRGRSGKQKEENASLPTQAH